MENNATNKTILIQECWKEMLKKIEMQRVPNCDQKPATDQVDNKSESGLVEMCLDQSMKCFTCLTGSTQNKIDISNISSVSSEKTDLKTFSVESKTKDKIHFQAPSVVVAQSWITGLQRLQRNQTSTILGEERRHQWLREIFQELSTTDHHKLTYEDVFKHVLNRKQGFVSRDFFQQKLKEFLKTMKLKYKKDGGFSGLEKFVKFYKFIFDRKEIVHLFQRIVSNGAFISPSDLQYFLTEEQYQRDITQEHCKEIIATYEVTQVGRENFELGVDGFTYFMLSVNNNLFNPDHDCIYQDMNQPLPHYYIASSHNTYLCGRQLCGDSSAQAYSDVLDKGCRCVELDCWDGDDNEPIVYHGYTLTTKILFKDIIKAINNSAFKTSQFPVIVSLENHCGLEAQKKMAYYLKDIFGDKMHTLTVDKSLGEFPSPEFFKNKILIRGKVDAVDDDDDDDDNQTTKTSIENKEGNKVPPLKKEADNIEVPASSSSTAKLTPPASPSTRRKKLKKKVAEELSDLINYISNAKFTSFEEADRNPKFWQSSSFVEGDMEYHADNTPEGFIRFNRRQLSRIYPGAMRIDSSNYSPIKPWNIGCQIVALNHQTNDEPLTLHYGKFRQNGCAGYVLKPSFLRDPSIKFNPNNVTKARLGSKVLKMTVISGQQLPEQNASWSVIKDEPDPYVQVQIYGIPADEFTFTTTTILDNSFNPTWNQSFQNNVLVPELAMVKFCVYDSDVGFDDFIGQSVLPFESLQQGYRHVPLEDKDGVAIPSASIFIHTAFEELKPNISKV